MYYKNDLHNELVWLADCRGHASDGAPGIHHRLSTGDRAARLESAILEASHHLK
jgi:hypothetical protein